MSEKKKIAIAVVITAAASILLTAAAFLIVSAVIVIRGGYDSKIGFIDAILEQKYLYDYDKNELIENAVTAYVDALDEPYTEYYTPEDFSSYTESLMDGYVGIGVIVGVNDNDEIEIIAPFEGSPAYEAGIVPGDILKAVNGTYYTGNELSDAVNAIRGGAGGTSVDIIIGRSGEEISLTIERGDISGESVKAEMLENETGYIRITQFNADSEDRTHNTASEFKDKLSELNEQGMNRLIIDLRDNPGGMLDVVCDIADTLLPEGLIMYTEDKYGKRKEYKSDASCVDVPMVVLINGNSASASEVLTGALKDHGAATVVGTTSYGKGVVQDVYTLPDGSGISLTTARYYTPSGVCIHEIGIEPDIKVELPEEYANTLTSLIERDKDTQLQKAIEIIKEK